MIRFNTGRWYSDKGQRIAAIKLENNGFVFADVDRNIDGYIAPDFLSDVVPEKLTQSLIMHSYDYGGYQHVPREYRDIVDTLRNFALEL